MARGFKEVQREGNTYVPFVISFRKYIHRNVEKTHRALNLALKLYRAVLAFLDISDMGFSKFSPSHTGCTLVLKYRLSLGAGNELWGGGAGGGGYKMGKSWVQNMLR